MANKHAILIVDDEPPILALLERGLSPYEDTFELSFVSSGAEALGVLAKRPIDLVVTDLFMPAMDGFELIERARAKNPAARFIVMTAYPAKDSALRAQQLGALFFLAKPFSLDAFADKLVEAFRPTAGFRASGLSGFHIGDALQLVHMARRSNIVTIKSEFQPDGIVVVQEGTLVHAEMGELVGEEAFFAIMALEGGEIVAEALDFKPRCTIERPLTQLVMESMRVMDERLEERRRKREGQGEVLVGEDAPPLSIASGDFYRMVDDGFDAYRSGDLGAARTFWEKAHELRPDDRAIRFNLRRLDAKESAGK